MLRAPLSERFTLFENGCKESSTPPCGRLWCNRSLLLWSSFGIACLLPIRGRSFVAPPLLFYTRLPPIDRRPLGFAPPPHDGFASLASAHTDALGCRHIPNACYECTLHGILAPRNTPWRIFFAEADASVLLCVMRSLMPALLPIFEGPDFPYSTYLSFCAAYLRIESDLRRESMYAVFPISDSTFATMPHRTGTMQDSAERARGEVVRSIHLPRASEM
jgi:hypothetical protein